MLLRICCDGLRVHAPGASVPRVIIPDRWAAYLLKVTELSVKSKPTKNDRIDGLKPK